MRPLLSALGYQLPCEWCHDLWEFIGPLFLWFGMAYSFGVLHLLCYFQPFYRLCSKFHRALRGGNLMNMSHSGVNVPKFLTFCIRSKCGSLCLILSTAWVSFFDDGCSGIDLWKNIRSHDMWLWCFRSILVFVIPINHWPIWLLIIGH